MKLIRDNYNLYTASGCVATLGNFDGVHVGHRTLLERLSQEKRVLGVPAVVITFEPLPKEFFAKGDKSNRLMNFKEKWMALSRYSIDYVLCLRFNTCLASLSPEAFIQDILVKHLKIKAIIVGDDCRFGADRRGDYFLLQKLGKQYHFSAEMLKPVLYDEERISSTRVRMALQTGNLALASALLDRPYRLSGRVMHGDKRGRIFGFPTANIFLRHGSAVLSGIFVVRVYWNGTTYPGVASLGHRPHFPTSQRILEVHLLNFNQSLYGQYIAIDFLHRLRSEERYPTEAALIAAIKKDVDDAKAYFDREI